MEVEEGSSISMLLQKLNVTSEKVAVELNLEILPKGEYDSRQLMDGDRVEVVAFVGGG
jgi:sulfur carrier protein